MEEVRQITIDEWMQWKEDIREKLKETAENFVYIGYRLKQIRDSGMYGGAADIFEFARSEYGLGKSTVSRFIAINEKFSEGGNSLELRAPYRTIGSSKLSEMLTLTDEECSLITEKTTVSQIRELKNFGRQAQEDEDGDSGKGERQSWTPLQKCIIEFFRGKKEMLDTAMGQIARNDNKGAAETVNPGGNTTFKKGIIFLFLYEYKDGVKYKTFGSEDITVMSWDDFVLEICEVFCPYYSVGVNGYDEIYKEPERRSEEGFVATSQQEEKTGGEDVEKMEDDEDQEETDQADNGPAEDGGDAGEPGDDEDGAGGMDGEDGEEPDIIDMGKCSLADIVTGIPAPAQEELAAAKERQMAAGMEEESHGTAMDSEAEMQARGYRAGIKSALTLMQYQYEKQDWDGLIREAKDVIWRAEQIRKMKCGEECEQ